MPARSLEALVQALLEQLPEESSPVVIVVKPDRPNPTPARTNGHRATSQGLLYDPSVVYILELATIITIRDAETIELIGQVVADALQNVVRDASNVHPLVISRVVFYLLHLLNRSQVTMKSRAMGFAKLMTFRSTRLSEDLSFFIPSLVLISQHWRSQLCLFLEDLRFASKIPHR